MNKFLLIFAFVLCACGVRAQADYSIQWGEVSKEYIRPWGEAFKNGNLYTYTRDFKRPQKIKKIYFRKFDPSLKMIEKTDFKKWANPSWKIDDYNLLGMVKKEEKIYTLLANKDKTNITVYLNELGDDLKGSATLTKLAEFPKSKPDAIYIMVPHDEPEDNKVYYRVSDNDKYRILYCIKKHDKSAKAYVQMLDSAFQPIWNKKYDFAITGKDFNLNNVIVTNGGNVFVNFNETTKRGFFGGAKEFASKMVLLDKEGKSKKIDNTANGADGTIYLSDYLIHSNPYSNVLNMAGLYGKKKSKINGIVSTSVDPETGKLLSSQTTPFGEKEYKQFLNDKDAAKATEKDKGLSNLFTIIGKMTTPDGGGVVLAEEYQETIVSNGKTSYTIWEYGDIIAVKTNRSGGIDWSDMFFRYQKSSNGRDFPYLGSQVFTDYKNMYLIYNDSKKNAEYQQIVEDDGQKRGKTKKTGKIKRASGFLKVIDMNTGNMTTEEIYDGKKEKTILNIQLSGSIDKDHVLLFASKKKKARIGIMTLHTTENLNKQLAEIAQMPATTAQNSTLPQDSASLASGIAPTDGQAPQNIQAKTTETPKPKPTYEPSQISHGRRVTPQEQSFFDELRKSAPKEQP